MGALRAGFHGTVGQPSAQVIDGSLKFDSGATNYLKKTPYVGNRKTWTISFWVKRSEGTSNEPGIFSTFAGSNPAFTCYFNAQDNLRIYDYTSSYIFQLKTNQVFRDYNSWYHIVISADITTSSPDPSDRLKVYVNGVRVTDFDTATESYPGSNVDLDWNTAYEHNIGKHSNEFDGNISNFYHIDGHSFGPEYFGFTDPLTNTWRPKKLEQFPKRSFTNPRWYSSATVYTSVADVVANATDRGNGGVTVTNEYCYLVFNDGGYGTSGGEVQSPDYPVWTDVASFSGITRVFYYDSGEADNWANAGSFSSLASEWNQWRYSNASSYETYRISPYMGIENGNMLVYCANNSTDTPTLAGTLASITLPTFDTNSFHFQNAAVDTWYTGGNSFYLPFDGNSPIGKDKFNNGNDWTPVNYGGSNTIDKATGALPILNTISGGKIATVGVRTDAFANNLVLALPFVDEHDVSHLVNSGSTQKVMVAYSNADASTTESNFYGGSFRFPGGTGDNVATAASSDFNFGSGDYTVEWWMYWTTKTDFQAVFDVGYTASDSFLIQSITGTSRFIVYAEGHNILEELATVGDAPISKWIHYAVVRNGDSMTLYRDGVVSATGSATAGSVTGTSHGSSTYIAYFGSDSQGYEFNGYLQDFRIYKGVAKYTEEFIPASTNPDILPDTPSGVSGGSKLAKITDGAVYFDGTGDYLNISGVAVGTGDFTIEYWINLAATRTPSVWWAPSTSSFLISDTGASEAVINSSTDNASGYSKLADAASSLAANTWGHVAVVRSSGTTTIYLNGASGGTTTNLTGSFDCAYIGRQKSFPARDLNGYISNLRIVNGTALYTSDFTPPTEPLTNVTNTILLCCQSNTDVTEGAVKPADVSWMPTGYTYWSGMDDNWNDSGTTTSDNAATDGDWLPTALPSTGKYYFETIVNNPGQYRVLGLATGQSGAGAGYTNFLFGYYWNGTGTPPKFLTKNSSDVSRAATGVVHGQDADLEFYDGDILMWAWDANDDKIYFGHNGNWFNDGDPVAGTGHIIENEDLSASSFYLKLGYMNSGGHALNKLSLTNVPSSESGSSSSIVPSREIVNYNLVNKASNFNPFNTDINTVRGQEINHCTWNPLHNLGTFPSTYDYSNGNLDFTTTSSPNLGGAATIGVKSGRWYWEIIHTELANNTYDTATYVAYDTFNLTARDRGIAYLADGQRRLNDVAATYGETYTTNDVIGVALDADNDKVTYFKNGVSQGELTITHLTPNTGYYPAIHQVNGSNNLTGSANFGQKPFKFPPPDGYQPLNNANVRPETVIARPDQYVGVTTYTGNGGTQTISGLNHKPDLVWLKARTAGGGSFTNNVMVDSVRGKNNYGYRNLYSNLADSEYDPPNVSSSSVTSLNANGFDIGGNANTNYDTATYVAWTWKAGGNSNTYNIDDKGYATASDVNMSAGALNSISYDQSQTWSNLDTYPTSYSPTTPANLFNGVVSTADADFWYSAGASTVRFDNLSDQLPDIVNTIELYVYDRTGDMTVTINGAMGNNYTNTGTYKWIKLTPNKKIVTLTVSGTDSVYWGIGAIKINGVMLANAGVTPTSVPSIAPTGCSVGTKQGFSIVGYEGTSVNNSTIPHGLTKKPQFILVKNRTDTFYWHVYHADMGLKWAEIYESIGYFQTNANYWTAEPTDNVFTTGIANGINANGHQHIAYLWHDVPGLQKFGIYEGNADTNGNGRYVELGFKPAILMLKNADTAEHWYVYDSERSPHNPAYQRLLWSSDTVEENSNVNARVDLLSSGFKLRQTNAPNTANTYVYAAWAESPAINLYGGQSNAR